MSVIEKLEADIELTFKKFDLLVDPDANDTDISSLLHDENLSPPVATRRLFEADSFICRIEAEIGEIEDGEEFPADLNKYQCASSSSNQSDADESDENLQEKAASKLSVMMYVCDELEKKTPTFSKRRRRRHLQKLQRCKSDEQIAGQESGTPPVCRTRRQSEAYHQRQQSSGDYGRGCSPQGYLPPPKIVTRSISEKTSPLHLSFDGEASTEQDAVPKEKQEKRRSMAFQYAAEAVLLKAKADKLIEQHRRSIHGLSKEESIVEGNKLSQLESLLSKKQPCISKAEEIIRSNPDMSMLDAMKALEERWSSTSFNAQTSQSVNPEYTVQVQVYQPQICDDTSPRQTLDLGTKSKESVAHKTNDPILLEKREGEAGAESNARSSLSQNSGSEEAHSPYYAIKLKSLFQGCSSPPQVQKPSVLVHTSPQLSTGSQQSPVCKVNPEVQILESASIPAPATRIPFEAHKKTQGTEPVFSLPSGFYSVNIPQPKPTKKLRIQLGIFQKGHSHRDSSDLASQSSSEESGYEPDDRQELYWRVASTKSKPTEASKYSFKQSTLQIQPKHTPPISSKQRATHVSEFKSLAVPSVKVSRQPAPESFGCCPKGETCQNAQQSLPRGRKQKLNPTSIQKLTCFLERSRSSMKKGQSWSKKSLGPNLPDLRLGTTPLGWDERSVFEMGDAAAKVYMPEGSDDSSDTRRSNARKSRSRSRGNRSRSASSKRSNSSSVNQKRSELRRSKSGSVNRKRSKSRTKRKKWATARSLSPGQSGTAHQKQTFAKTINTYLCNSNRTWVSMISFFFFSVVLYLSWCISANDLGLMLCGKHSLNTWEGLHCALQTQLDSF